MSVGFWAENRWHTVVKECWIKINLQSTCLCKTRQDDKYSDSIRDWRKKQLVVPGVPYSCMERLVTGIGADRSRSHRWEPLCSHHPAELSSGTNTLPYFNLLLISLVKPIWKIQGMGSGQWHPASQVTV